MTNLTRVLNEFLDVRFVEGVHDVEEECPVWKAPSRQAVREEPHDLWSLLGGGPEVSD